MSNTSEATVQTLHETILEKFSEGLAHGASIPTTLYRRRLYFEGMATLGQNIIALSAAAALIATRQAGEEQC